MTFEDAMIDLTEAIAAAVKAAGNEDGMPECALMAVQADIASIDHCGMPVKEYKALKALYDGEKLAGLTNA